MKARMFRHAGGMLLVMALCAAGQVRSQVVYTSQPFPRADQPVSVFFRSDQGSGGLANYTGDIYAHTGVITENSTSGSDWKYVKTNWGVNIPATKLVKIADHLYRLDITPSVRSYYGVPASEKILSMAFVFRSDLPANNGAYFEGKTASGGDIYIDLYEDGLNLKLVSPFEGPFILDAGDTIDIRLYSQDADSTFLFLNDALLAANTLDSIGYVFTASQTGKFRVKGVAIDSFAMVADSCSFIVVGPPMVEPLPAGIREGINVTGPQSVTFCLYAPLKERVFVIGDFNDWEPDTAFYMKRTPDGQRYWVEVNGLDPDREYIFQYLVDGLIAVGDPYAEKVSDPWNDSYISEETYPGMLDYPAGRTSGIATVFRINEPDYQWSTNSFTPPGSEDLVIYELLVRDFTDKHSFQAVIDSLAYFKRLGVNAIELMPVNEFEGNSSWGYNPNYYFAVDKYYGRKNDLKRLIDTLHQHGIAVILDVVYNHSFGTSPYVMLYWDRANNRPSANSPFYNMIPKHDFNVGFDFKHDSPATRRYIGRALKFWLEEYRIDGYRFDLSKGFTQRNTLGNVDYWGQYDQERIEILSDYADTVWSVNASAYVILEHFAYNSEETELASRGMMLWGNLNHAYAEAAMGYHSNGKSDFSSISWKNRGWDHPGLVGYMESHDEERIMYKCLQYGAEENGYDVKDPVTALHRIQLDALFFYTVPGPKMLWQFGELGYDFSIDYNGRTGEKPIRWDYYQDEDRHNLFRFFSALIQLRKEEEVFRSETFGISASSGLKHIVITHPAMNAVVVGNFLLADGEASPPWPHTGMWYDFFTGDSLKVEATDQSLTLAPGEYHLFTDRRLEPPPGLEPVWRLLPDFSEGLIHIYPNPSAGDLSIYVETGLEEVLEADIRFTDLSGRLINGLKVSVKDRAVISLAEHGISLPSGVFLCQVTVAGSTETEKVIIR